MRPDRVLLLDMLGAAQAILQFVEGMTLADFEANQVVRSAVIYQFLIIGEAASRVSKTTKDANPTIPWRAIVGMRNQLIHGYFSAENVIVWTTIESQLPALIAALEGLVPPEA